MIINKTESASFDKTIVGCALTGLLPIAALGLLLGSSTELMGLLVLSFASPILVYAFLKHQVSIALWAAFLAFLGYATYQQILTPLRFYPVMLSCGAAVVFIASYWDRHTLVERIAMRMEKDLPTEALSYCRRVHHLWSSYLIANSFICWYLAAFGSLTAWALYTGVLSYLFAGVLFFGEYCYRLRFKRRLQKKIASDAAHLGDKTN